MTAIDEAKALGAEIQSDPVIGFWWRAGRRSALDQYGKTFPTELAAAEDFLQSREATTARTVRARRDPFMDQADNAFALMHGVIARLEKRSAE